ncbi:hypothetical protein SLS60_005630 [Paraconiothyrium brasiliense]|uniref:DUF7730 domain-containing protein n=1 Tax=Paraconiothyrium brasiliense TaxID=300254 RepID=A0ABR3RIC9_9PLEO
MAISRSPNGLLELPKAPDHLVAINATESPLLLLPAELRNRIFRYASSGCQIHIKRRPLAKTPYPRLDANKPSFLYSKVFEQDTDRQLPPTHTGLNLALVSRQVYCETALLPYVYNTFVLDLTVREADHKGGVPGGVGLWLSQFVEALKPAQLSAFQSILLTNNGNVLLLELFLALISHGRMTSTFPAVQKIFVMGRFFALGDWVPSYLKTAQKGLPRLEEMGLEEAGRALDVMVV